MGASLNMQVEATIKVPSVFDYADAQGFFLAHFSDRPIVAVEVGSWVGQSSLSWIEQAQVRGKALRLYCVDTWGMSELKTVVPGLALPPDTIFSAFFHRVHSVVGENNPRGIPSYILPIQRQSTEAAVLFADQSLNLVFIDGSHDYNSVKADIQAWARTVKPGGFLAGHDYDWGEVYLAVNDAARFLSQPNFKFTVYSIGRCWYMAF